MTIVTADSDYLSAQLCMDKMFKDIVIIDEAVEVENEYQGKKTMKLQVNISTKTNPPMTKLWSMNATSKRSMISLFGNDTKKWIGKKIKLQLVEVQGKKTIYVDDIESKQLNTVEAKLG